MKALTVSLALVTAAASSADPDFTLGYSKVSGMAGAGLALRHEGTGAYPRNPAGLAFMQQTRLTNLDLGYALRGVGFSDVNDFLGGVGRGGLNPDDLAEIAREFGDDTTEFGLNARVALGSSGVNVGFGGSALVKTTPNAALRQWVDAGSDPNNPVPGMRLDGHGYGYHSFDVGYGRPIPSRTGDTMAVGAQLRFVKSYYGHHFASQAQILNGGSSRAVEMGTEDVLSKSGMGADVGWYMESGRDRRVEYAVVVSNLVEPRVGFGGTEPDSLTPTQIDPFERALNLGLGVTGERGEVAALDVINIGAREADVRMGVDVPWSRQFGARAGYSGRGGFTAGITLFGVSVSFGTTNQFQASTFFRF